MEKDGISLFVTSREYPEDIQDSFQNSPKIRLWAKDEDITLYVGQKIDSNPRAKRIVGQAKCKDRIISELIDCAKGMFLLVHFHIEYLCKQTTVRQILMGLESLKESSHAESPLSPTYDRAMEILKAQPKNCVDLVLNTLSWLVKARRVLTVAELQMALSVEQDQTDFDANNLPDRKTMLDVCASFVTVDEDTDTVRLAHYTVQEYLLKNSIILSGAEFRLAMACTTFLSFGAFDQGFCHSEVSYEARNSSYPFLDYAAKQLSFHLSECAEALTTEIVLRFLSTPGGISSFYQSSVSPASMDISIEGVDRCPLHVATDLGHCSAVRLLLENVDVMVLGSKSTTALHLAARNGHIPMVHLLLESGANISAVEDNQATALHEAASKGHEPVVKLLLENGADILAVTNRGETGLFQAAYNGHLSVVRLLLEGGADISLARDDGETALTYAAFHGHEPVVRLLLENGADVSASDYSGWTALHNAASAGYEPVVRLLLESGADTSPTNKDGKTALCQAASRGYEPVVRLLLESGADTSPADNDGETALTYAALDGHGAVVQLLLEYGADISASDNNGWTSLHNAVYSGHEPVVQLLIENRADISAVESDGETALQLAESRGYESIARLLTEALAEVSN